MGYIELNIKIHVTINEPVYWMTILGLFMVAKTLNQWWELFHHLPKTKGVVVMHIIKSSLDTDIYIYIWAIFIKGNNT